jgi:hypothetical protein
MWEPRCRISVGHRVREQRVAMARKRISKKTVGRAAGKGAGKPMRSVDVYPASPLLELRIYAPGEPGASGPSVERREVDTEPKGSVIEIDLC